MLVAQHKRQVNGPAVISFMKELKEMLDVYVEKKHPYLWKPKDENLFLNNSGKAFAGANISTRVPEFWQKTEVRLDIKVTATNTRKWIVTVCHQKKCEGVDYDENVLRRAMCHSDRLAQSNYLQDDLTAVGAEANHIIARCTNQTPVSSKQHRLKKTHWILKSHKRLQATFSRTTRKILTLDHWQHWQKRRSNASFNRKSQMWSSSSKMCARNWVPAWLCENYCLTKRWSEKSPTACGIFRQRSQRRNQNSCLKVANLVELLIGLHLQRRRWVPKNASGRKTTGPLL